MEAIDLSNTALLLGAGLIVAGILSSLIATRFGAPILLMFLAVGVLAGEDGPGGLRFSDYRLTYLIGSLSLAIILFDGGLRTRFLHVRAAVIPATVLATIGVVLTAGLTAVFAVWVLDIGFKEGFLIGAVIASTDAAAVFFLLRSGGLQLRSRVGALLELESSVNDPVAIFLTVAAVSVISTVGGGAETAQHIIIDLGRQAFLGTLIGLGGGFGIVALLNRVSLPSGLAPLLAVSGGVLVFGIAASLGGSGFLAAYVAGLVLGNRPVRAFSGILSLHNAVTWLAQIVMFLALGLLVSPHQMLAVAIPSVAIALFLIFIARPIAVWLSLWPFGFNSKERAFVGWVGLRGAVSIFLASIPTLSGLPGSHIYFNVAFFVVLVSLSLQGSTIKLAARRLGQALPRTGYPVTRTEVDLPGQHNVEMIGYPVGHESRVLSMTKLPDWAKLALVVREGNILEPVVAGALRAGDYAYLLAPELKTHSLDSVFAPATERRGMDLEGEFAIRGDAPIDKIEQFYSLGASADQRKKTVAEFFAENFDKAPEIGDSLMVGQAQLIVREMAGDDVFLVALHLEPVQAQSLRARLRTAAHRLSGGRTS
ncbi:MAG TPA: potassium/proton antiporter [Rhizomicrobium sp.]|nr:potassium/proton antiporter [Rhizomicrobium sp.]